MQAIKRGGGSERGHSIPIEEVKRRSRITTVESMCIA